MRKNYCDRCGAELPSFKEILMDWWGNAEFEPNQMRYELCIRCAKKVDDFITTKEGDCHDER